MHFSIRALRLVAALLALGAGALARDGDDEKEVLPGHSAHGEAFNEGPRRKAFLMPGMGKIAFEITTRSPEAQAFFLQGVGQLHGFYYFEAERSFRTVAFLDPDCAMAYWGMAMANINTEKRAKEFLAKAVKLQEKAGARERMWIQSLSDYYAVPPAEKEKRARTYVRALEALVREYPADLEAKAFLVWCLWYHKDKGLPIGSAQAVDSIIQEVLRAEPLHNGIHHYRIHLWDDEKAAVALPSAELFGPSSPGIAHAWHMPGHIYSKLHRYADAARQQEAAARTDHAHMIADATLPYQIHNFAHNNQWCITDEGYVGRVREAIELAENMIQIPRHPKLNRNDQADGCFRLGRARLLETLLAWELWDELLWRADTSLAPIDQPDDTILRLRVTGAAGFNAGKLDLARKALAELEGMIAKESVPDESDPKKKDEAQKTRDGKLKPVRNAIEELRGWEYLSQGDSAAALDHFRKSEDFRKDAFALVQNRAGRPEEALKTAKAAKEAAPGQLHPLAVYLEILLSQGKADPAAQAELDRLAVYASPGLPILERLRPLLPHAPRQERWPDQAALGPLGWGPSPAPAFALPDANGGSFNLHAAADNPIILLFYLGSKCKHCVEQLGKFSDMSEDFRKANLTIVAVSTETPEQIKKACTEDPKKSFPFLLLSDPSTEVFKKFHCWDDFENVPLHGTFLVDAKDRDRLRIRWQDISYDPFMDPKFLLQESARLLSLKAP
jgi:peroxiredoxin